MDIKQQEASGSPLLVPDELGFSYMDSGDGWRRFTQVKPEETPVDPPDVVPAGA